MNTLKKIITNKILWVAIVTVGTFWWGSQYLDQTSGTKQKVVAAKLKLTKDLYGVAFPSRDKGWIVGEDGLIAHTVDQGGTWKIQKSGVTTNLVAVNFSNPQKGFAVGASGTLLMTVNGGDTWGKKQITTEVFLNDICFPTTGNGFIVGESGTVLSTKDGGETWLQDKSLFEDRPPWLIPELKCIYFSSPRNGWIVGEFGAVLKTVDGGMSWNIVDLGTEDTLFGISFFDQSSGYIVGVNGLILATKDGGKTWDKTFKRETNLFRIAYRDYREGSPVYIAGDGELIFAMQDKNSRFKSAMIDNFDVNYSWLHDIKFVSSIQAYAVGKSGLILHITSGEGDMWGVLDYNVVG
jgi:photosystem II stability/assembly factor-like uncharacterized protein